MAGPPSIRYVLPCAVICRVWQAEQVIPAICAPVGPDAVKPTGNPFVVSGLGRYPYRVRLSPRNGWPLGCLRACNQARGIMREPWSRP